jgi:hypothetical protein
MAKNNLIQARITPAMKQAITSKIKLINTQKLFFEEKTTETKVITDLLEKWLKNEIKL